ncbi:hypothetical protein ANN_01197 [Periplaneta americana]|uniref:Uncharacterized protein n=1 Tax=Periplaneta americana TaxID=6978 RepID=A0ABQ8TVD4_PERAM|nr:hypothetical protein ANN_01197 [Periplaneta americana]
MEGNNKLSDNDTCSEPVAKRTRYLGRKKSRKEEQWKSNYRKLGANPSDVRTKTDLDIDKRKVTEYEKSPKEIQIVSHLSCTTLLKGNSENAGGQNKNFIMCMFCSYLAVSLKTRVSQIFPVRGHSYCQCDRNFGIYSKKLKRKSRVGTGPDYDNIISKSAEVVNGKGILKSWGSTLNPFFQRKLKSKGKVFTLQKYCKLMYSTTGNILACASYNATCEPFSFMLKPIRFPSKLSDTVPVAPKKEFKVDTIRDVRSTYEFLKEDEVAWFEEQFKNTTEESGAWQELQEQDENLSVEASGYENIVASVDNF